MADKLLSVAEVAAMLHVSTATVYRLAEKGEIPTVKVGFQFRFNEEKLKAWIDAGGQKTPTEVKGVPDIIHG